MPPKISQLSQFTGAFTFPFNPPNKHGVGHYSALMGEKDVSSPSPYRHSLIQTPIISQLNYCHSLLTGILANEHVPAIRTE